MKLKWIALMMTITAGMGVALHGQEKAAGIEPPMTGMVVLYQFWPETFVQWLGPELPYSMIELNVDPKTATPVYEAVLTDRVSHKRIHYSNNASVVEAGKAQDGEAYQAKMEFVAPEAQANGAVYSLKFNLHDGTPLEWRFVQGSDISEQGAGLTPIVAAKRMGLVYREQGALAGEGTALQIGDKVSVAEMWKEISHPPYFVAYRGALSQSGTTVILASADERWTVTKAPSALSAGAEWALTSRDGRARTMKIDKASGDHFVITSYEGTVRPMKQTIEATHGAAGWAIDRVLYRPADATEAHGFSMVFTPALTTGTSTAEFVIGKKTRIATATVVTVTDASERKVNLTMTSPKELKDKVITSSASARVGPMGPLAKSE